MTRLVSTAKKADKAISFQMEEVKEQVKVSGK
jgi:hypothetical protein